MRIHTLVFLLLGCVTTQAASADTRENQGPARDWAEAVQLANSFIAQLNLSEKADFVTGKIGTGPGGCVGNIFGIERLNFSGLCLQDGPQGVNLADLVSAFPAAISTGASWDKELMYLRGRAIGEEFRGKGINIALGPQVGPLGRHPLGGRNWETYSPDPYLSGIAAELTIKGIQSAGVQTCAKHIVGNEQETQRTNSVSRNGTRIEGISSNFDDRTMHELYLWPFADAIRAGTTSLMCSFNRLNGTYACENPRLLDEILRKELGFEGFVVSDWFATHSGAKSINAGLDLNMPGFLDIESVETGASYWGITNITAMIDDGSVTEKRIDEMIRRIMSPYYYMGQDRDDFPSIDISMRYSFAAWTGLLGQFPPPHPAIRDVRGTHSELIRKMGAEATVLLKNVNSTLPLKEPANIGVFGNDAADPTEGLVFNRQFEIGTLDIGSGAGTIRHSYLVSPLEGIRSRARKYGARVQHLIRNSVIAEDDFSTLYPIPDVCLVFLKSYAGEMFDRESYEADWNSTLVVENVAARCPNTIVITHSAGANTMPWVDNPNVTAILAAHYPGQDSGDSIADVLWGDVNPSGRLPYTIPVREEDLDIPIVNLTEPEVISPTAWEANFTEGLMIDYRRLDAKGIKPLYEFGFGLSYTTFEMSPDIELEQLVQGITAKPDFSKPIAPGGRVNLWDTVLRLSTNVTNSGPVAGATVAQLYLSMPANSVPDNTPVQVLRGFEKIRLQPGESKPVQFEVRRRDLSYWDVVLQGWVIPKGCFTFKLGLSSRDIQGEVEHSVLGGSCVGV